MALIDRGATPAVLPPCFLCRFAQKPLRLVSDPTLRGKTSPSFMGLGRGAGPERCPNPPGKPGESLRRRGSRSERAEGRGEAAAWGIINEQRMLGEARIN